MNAHNVEDAPVGSVDGYQLRIQLSLAGCGASALDRFKMQTEEFDLNRFVIPRCLFFSLSLAFSVNHRFA